LAAFNAYTLNARIAPALLVLLPLLAGAFAWFPAVATLPGLSAMAACGAAAGAILASQVRSEGLRLERLLFAEWGAPPTTIMLRHGDTSLSKIDKARYHARLQELVPGIQMPTAAVEAADPKAADEQYETATAWLRERTRDASAFPIVDSANANYGFYRNLCASRTPGWIAAVVGVVNAVALLWFKGFSLGVLAALVISIACALMFWSYAGPKQVEQAARDYAKALIRAIDGVNKPE
jgi:hypothetical protein